MRRALTPLLALTFLFTALSPTSALEPLEGFLRSTTLAGPSALIVDPSDGKVILEKSPDELRTPASLLKLISTSTALHYLGTEKRYITSIWSTDKDGSYVIKGGMDPWLTSSGLKAEKNNQRYLPNLIASANTPKRKYLTIYYSNMYKQDLTELVYQQRKAGIRIKAIPISISDADAKAKSEIQSMTSEPITTMVSYAILWSVNELADRLGKQAVKKQGNPLTPQGITTTFKSALKDLGVQSEGLYVEDGSGLSKATRAAPRIFVELLIKIRHDPELQAIYVGLPVAGETGTLKNRFSTAREAVGKVHAKTGLLRTVASLAGYVDVGSREYVFAIIADQIPPGSTAQRAARKTIDEMVGSIVKGNT